MLIKLHHDEVQQLAIDRIREESEVIKMDLNLENFSSYFMSYFFLGYVIFI